MDGAPALGCSADRAPRRRAARPRSDQGDRPALASREVEGRLRCALRARRGRAGCDRAPDARDRCTLRVAMTRPLLVVDGDSFAHRAYHALPKSINRNAVVGFTNMVVRLWEQEEPRAVLVGWDTLEVPTYRHEAFAAYQSGRKFDASLLEQLALLPQLCTALRFATAKGAGYEADDFLAAAVAHE